MAEFTLKQKEKLTIQALSNLQSFWMRRAGAIKGMVSRRPVGPPKDSHTEEKGSSLWLILNLSLLVVALYVLHLFVPALVMTLYLILFGINILLMVTYFVIQGEKLRLVNQTLKEPSWETFEGYIDFMQGNSSYLFKTTSSLRKETALYQGFSPLFPLRDLIWISFFQVFVFAGFMQCFYAAVGPDSFQSTLEPHYFTWCLFALENALRAADIFDSLDIYRIYFLHLHPVTFLAGLPVILFRLSVDLFLLAAIKRYLALRQSIKDSIASLPYAFEASKIRLIKIGSPVLPFLRQKFNREILAQKVREHRMEEVDNLIYGFRVLVHFQDPDAMKILEDIPQYARQHHIPQIFAIQTMKMFEEIDEPDLSGVEEILLEWLEEDQVLWPEKNSTAISLLGKYGPKKHLPRIGQGVCSPHRPVRILAVTTLMERMGKGAAEILIPYLHSEDGRVVLLTIEALARLRSGQGIEDLLSLTEHKYWEIRSAAWRALGYIEGGKDFPCNMNDLAEVRLTEGDEQNILKELLPAYRSEVYSKIPHQLDRAFDDPSPGVLLDLLDSDLWKLTWKNLQRLCLSIQHLPTDSPSVLRGLKYCMKSHHPLVWSGILNRVFFPLATEELVEAFVRKGIDRWMKISSEWSIWGGEERYAFIASGSDDETSSPLSNDAAREMLGEIEEVDPGLLSPLQEFSLSLLRHLIEPEKLSPDWYEKHLSLSNLSPLEREIALEVLTKRATPSSTDYLLSHLRSFNQIGTTEEAILSFLGEILEEDHEDSLYFRRQRFFSTVPLDELVKPNHLIPLYGKVEGWLREKPEILKSNQTILRVFLQKRESLRGILIDIVETSPHPDLTEKALEILLEGRQTANRKWILGQIHHSHSSVRSLLIQNLKALSPVPAESIKILSLGISDPSENVRWHAMGALGKCLGSSNYGWEKEDEKLLLDRGNRRVKKLILRCFQDSDSDIRRRAWEDLVGFLKGSQRISLLKKASRDRSEEVRQKAFESFLNEDSFTPSFFLLKRWTTSRREEFRLLAARILERILNSGNDRSDMERFIEGDAFLEEALLSESGEKGENVSSPEKYYPLVKKGLRDSSIKVAYHCFACLKEEDLTPEILPLVERILFEEPEGLSPRVTAYEQVSALNKIRALRWSFISNLVERCLDHPENTVRSAAREILWSQDRQIPFGMTLREFRPSEDEKEALSLIKHATWDPHDIEQQRFLIEEGLLCSSYEVAIEGAEKLLLYPSKTPESQEVLEKALRAWMIKQVPIEAFENPDSVDLFSMDRWEGVFSLIQKLAEKLPPEVVQRWSKDSSPLVRKFYEEFLAKS